MTSVRIPIVRNHLNIRHIGVIVSLLCYLTQALTAQISQGGNPYSFSAAILDSIATSTMATLDVVALVAEDELEAAHWHGRGPADCI